MAPRIGFGHRTLRSASWDGDRLRVGTAAPGVDSSGYWVKDRGDGTVPAVAALPVEMDNVRPRGFRAHAKHGPMVDVDVRDMLREYLDIPAVGLAYRDPNRSVVSLGLDLDDAWPADVSIPVGVSVWANDATTSTPLLLEPGTAGSVRLAVADSQSGEMAAEAALAWDGDAQRFAAMVPALRPGVYDVKVTAWALTDTPATQLLEVVGDVD